MTEREALTIFRTIQKCRHQALHTNDCGNCERCQYRLEQEQIDGAVALAISVLEKQERDRWIPVTERLPEENGHYLVTLFDEIDSWTEPLYWNTTFGGRWQGFIEDDFSDIGNVSAWRPLPEPYTEEEA